MEEIIIFEKGGNIVGITKEGKYFESYRTTNNVAILRGAGLYIQQLEQENAELKAYKDVNKDFKTAWEELKAENELLKKDKIGLHSEIKQLEQENKELKVENERLKEENYQLQKDCQICENFIDFIPCKPIRDMDYALQMVINERDKYIQTLQEIKKICKNSHTSASKDYYRTADKIQVKINEVIGAEG